MKKLALFDTSIASPNLGDQIIMEAVEEVMMELFPNDYKIKFQTHDVISSYSYKLIEACDYKFVGGTNILTSKADKSTLWKISKKDMEYIKKVILLGVGWSSYQGAPNAYSTQLYQGILSKTYLHSVRDSYTENKLKSIGIKNTLNTACPTMWGLTKEHCKEIPKGKSEGVLYTVGGKREEKVDQTILELLQKNYKKIYFWPQGVHDDSYMKTLNVSNVEYLPPSLKALDQFLLTTDVDYIGNRLHGGIRALKHKKRTLILAVDNRATEIARDTNLPVIPRKDVSAVQNWIHGAYTTAIQLPEENIQKWKAQFR